MLWRDDRGDLDSVYAIFADGTYRAFSRLTDPFHEGVDPEYSCGIPASPPSPRRGFSKVWCNRPDVRSKLGDALEREIGYCIPGGEACETFQDFAGGMIYRSTRFGAIFVLYGNGTWETMPSVGFPTPRIASVSQRTGSAQIFVINDDGSDQRQLTSHGENGEPAWSPNNRQIVFASSRDGKWTLYIMNTVARPACVV